ncbi:GGDEF domain-containing protein [Ningiella sp. W23]|uniref:GGDEF domain-containing protein n=1 Tax=Ningiella sp. W23 TaxID=3023715 RepID=UPI0037569C7B
MKKTQGYLQDYVHNHAGAVFASIFVLMIAVSGFFAIKDLAAEQSQRHQQSISPVFALVERELIRPLHTAKTIADLGYYSSYFLAEQPDESSLMPLLKDLENEFGHEFYLAHEVSKKQFNSSGRTFDLIEGEVIWYFALRDEFDSEVQAVLGNREDPHLYIDVRQYNDEGKFLGFAGLGKSLNDFLDSFDTFRQEYGHEFLFVNNREEIVLSSLAQYSPTQADGADARIGIKNINDVEWFPEFLEETKEVSEPSIIVRGAQGGLLVSQLKLESLNWNLYVMTPLDARQEDVNRSYTLYVALSFLVLLIVFKVVHHITDRFLDSRNSRANIDELTNLANREYGRTFFNRVRRRHHQMSVILCGLDNLNEIREKYGSETVNEVIAHAADSFLKAVGSKDLVVRWGSEEFVVIMSEQNESATAELAESLRSSLAASDEASSESGLLVTGSFGVYSSRQLSDTLDFMVDRANKAMFEAKTSGKNKVVVAS